MAGILSFLFFLALLVFLVRVSRGRSFTRQLPRILEEASARNLITPQQRADLLALAEEHRQGPSLKASAWVAILSGLFVTAGLSLILAHNWEEIGPLARVAGFLILLAAAGEASIRTRERSPALSLPLEFLWFFLPLLGIGLYAQTFQLSGDPIQPFLLWLVLTLPLAWAGQRPYLGIAHLLVLAGVLFTGNHDYGMLRLTANVAGSWDEVSLGPWLLSAIIWAVLVLECRRFLPPFHRTHLIALAAIWLFSLQLGKTPFHVAHGGMLLSAALSLTVLWMLIPLLLRRTEAPNLSGVVPWLGLLYGLTFLWHSDGGFDRNNSASGVILYLVSLAAALVAVWFAPLHRLHIEGRWRHVARGCIVLSLVLSVLPQFDDPIAVRTSAVAANLLLAFVAGMMMWHGGRRGLANLVNFGVAILMLLLITRFVDVLGDMFRSGIGLLFAGLLLGGFAYAMDRGRRKLLSMIRGGS